MTELKECVVKSHEFLAQEFHYGGVRFIAIKDHTSMTFEVVPVFASAKVTENMMVQTYGHSYGEVVKYVYEKMCYDLGYKFKDMFLKAGAGK